jgi:hypothetical protein
VSFGSGPESVRAGKLTLLSLLIAGEVGVADGVPVLTFCQIGILASPDRTPARHHYVVLGTNAAVVIGPLLA